jgi:predicted nucleic acid-binding protein
MCLIVDTNCLSHVFNINDEKHSEFEPVFNWINNGNGKLIIGGTKYLDELQKVNKILDFIVELSRNGKVVYIDNSKVDSKQKEIENKIKDKDFDDHHLIALLIVSSCKIICSLDKRAYEYFKYEKFFPTNKPKIYSGKKNKNLLNSRNIIPICKSKSFHK